MKHLYILILLTFLTSCKKEPNYDYIENYYQYVYDADIAYLEDDYETAYNLLKKAEANCPLLNQPIYYEVDKLAELSVKYGNNEDALNYIERLIKQEGYNISSYENNNLYDVLHDSKKWKDLKANYQIYHENYLKTINIDLREEIKNMKYLDQLYRKKGDYDMVKCDSIDSLNESRMKKIIEVYGFPDDDVIGSYGIDNSPVNIGGMFMHFQDTAYFKKVLIPLVRKGSCSPIIYPSMIDSQQRRTGEFIYGVYSNHTKDDVIDSENLDKRRLAVGLPTKETQTKRSEIMKKKYNFN